MTGYGEARRETPAGTLLVEVRTVNHRHFSANLRLPQALARWERENGEAVGPRNELLRDRRGRVVERVSDGCEAPAVLQLDEQAEPAGVQHRVEILINNP